jgi:hypothetical protein
MKTFRNLMLLLLTASLLSSCYVQEQGRGYGHHRRGYGHGHGHGHGWHHGY